MIFITLLCVMLYKAGTQVSLSALADKWRWLLLVALWSQVLLLPQMLEITPTNWQWVTSLGIFAIIICGGANIYDKTDEIVHIIAAVIAFSCFLLWIIIINWLYIVPLIVCICAGKERWKWRAEIGLIIGAYMTLLAHII